MADVVLKYYNIISSILNSLNAKDVETEWQQWNLRLAIESILKPLNLESSTIDKIEVWIKRVLNMIKIGVAIAAPLLQLWNLLANASPSLGLNSHFQALQS